MDALHNTGAARGADWFVPPMSELSEHEIRQIVAETVAETLTRLGVDAANPKEMQADFQHLRDWRESIKTVKRQGLMTAVGVITVGFLGLLWAAFTKGN